MKTVTAFSEIEQKHDNPAVSLSVHEIISIIYVTMHKEKAPIIMHRSKAPKHSKFSVTDIREKPVDLFNGTTRTLT